MKRLLSVLLVGLTGLLNSWSASAGETMLSPWLHHLRAGSEREWSDFPLRAEGSRLDLPFQAVRNPSEWTLRLRQQDVKQAWQVLVNGSLLGRLTAD
jgi:hypothetical protein